MDILFTRTIKTAEINSMDRALFKMSKIFINGPVVLKLRFPKVGDFLENHYFPEIFVRDLEDLDSKTVPVSSESILSTLADLIDVLEVFVLWS